MCRRLALTLHTNTPAGNKAVTSPKTNLRIDPNKIHLYPNVSIRSLAIEYKETKTREWEAAERRWQAWQAQQQQQQQQAQAQQAQQEEQQEEKEEPKPGQQSQPDPAGWEVVGQQQRRRRR